MYIANNPNPIYPDTHHLGLELDKSQIELAAKLLNRQIVFTDREGFEREIEAASVHPDNKQIVYLERWEKPEDIWGFVEIYYLIYHVNNKGVSKSVGIESYNYYFGCRIRYIAWFDELTAVLIYKEKHSYYLYIITNMWPPKFVEIEYDWQIINSILFYRDYKANTVSRLMLPDLTAIAPLTLSQAQELGFVIDDDKS
ncbi:hypothetical protein [Chamaesiphon minutus]|uniref:Uncharacterized protein n=1 Tax=Chamaesiphon minutus (strain ATCC 27169 / PCC 6605) TaxID=1173020 RepID=K9UNP7_CHAP6|nr:hypothetical protein [Chamaesiphon minutus]AFY96445.1 hypothetical protein Cha6605_5569 [Chamaesiphon minutus PCC 6605]